MGPARRRDFDEGQQPVLTMLAQLDELADFIEARPCRWISEYDVQQHLVELLGPRGFAREHTLTPTERPDFWHPGLGVAVEVKIRGTPSRVFQQLLRYAYLEPVKGLLVVTTKAKLVPPGFELGGKPFSAARIWNWALK